MAVSAILKVLDVNLTGTFRICMAFRPALARSNGSIVNIASLKLCGHQILANDYRKRVGHSIVRHICADGLLSRPSPSLGCLKCRPMISVKSSRSTLALGSNE
jgi:hypothetical protein